MGEKEINFKFGIYRYKGVLYETIKSIDKDGLCKMKNPQSRKWERCVLYTYPDSRFNDVYVREVNEFLERFEYMGD